MSARRGNYLAAHHEYLPTPPPNVRSLVPSPSPHIAPKQSQASMSRDYPYAPPTPESIAPSSTRSHTSTGTVPPGYLVGIDGEIYLDWGMNDPGFSYNSNFRGAEDSVATASTHSRPRKHSYYPVCPSTPSTYSQTTTPSEAAHRYAQLPRSPPLPTAGPYVPLNAPVPTYPSHYAMHAPSPQLSRAVSPEEIASPAVRASQIPTIPSRTPSRTASMRTAISHHITPSSHRSSAHSAMKRVQSQPSFAAHHQAMFSAHGAPPVPSLPHTAAYAPFTMPPPPPPPMCYGYPVVYGPHPHPVYATPQSTPVHPGVVAPPRGKGVIKQELKYEDDGRGKMTLISHAVTYKEKTSTLRKIVNLFNS